MKDPSSIQSVKIHFLPIGAHNSGLDISTAQMLTPDPNATTILLQALVKNVRYTLDGTMPTPTLGFQLVAGDPPVLLALTSCTCLKVIEEAATASLQYQWGK